MWKWTAHLLAGSVFKHHVCCSNRHNRVVRQHYLHLNLKHDIDNDSIFTILYIWQSSILFIVNSHPEMIFYFFYFQPKSHPIQKNLEKEARHSVFQLRIEQGTCWNFHWEKSVEKQQRFIKRVFFYCLPSRYFSKEPLPSSEGNWEAAETLDGWRWTPIQCGIPEQW